ncbi:hypothetical protein CIK76_15985 [Glutamicibacter sp. BW80]|nr:hypothetical protein CIK76_15985 [Glutamicibacter sp. BW80]
MSKPSLAPVSASSSLLELSSFGLLSCSGASCVGGAVAVGASSSVGSVVGSPVGSSVGSSVGSAVGSAVGSSVGVGVTSAAGANSPNQVDTLTTGSAAGWANAAALRFASSACCSP